MVSLGKLFLATAWPLLNDSTYSQKMFCVLMSLPGLLFEGRIQNVCLVKVVFFGIAPP